jgi:hypothetical protein
MYYGMHGYMYSTGYAHKHLELGIPGTRSTANMQQQSIHCHNAFQWQCVTLQVYVQLFEHLYLRFITTTSCQLPAVCAALWFRRRCS